MSWLDDLLNSQTVQSVGDWLGTEQGGRATEGLFNLGLSYGAEALGLNDPQIQKTGYLGEVPRYDAVRERVPDTYDPLRRPGSSGQRYFTNTQFLPQGSQPAGLGAAGLAALNLSNPARQTRPVVPATLARGGIVGFQNEGVVNSLPATGGMGEFPRGPVARVTENLFPEAMADRPQGLSHAHWGAYKIAQWLREKLGREPTPQEIEKAELNFNLAQGGIVGLREGKYVNGATSGMADAVPANIEGTQEARLSDGEFVVPADVVSHLGNGNSDAGADELYDMMDRVRKARTGMTKQAKEIDPREFLPA